jgi:hypothetical protein
VNGRRSACAHATAHLDALCDILLLPLLIDRPALKLRNPMS